MRPLKRKRGSANTAFQPRRHSRAALERLLSENGFTITGSWTIGYSPLSIMRRPLRGRLALGFERQLARHATAPVVRNIGVHVVTRATAPDR